MKEISQAIEVIIATKSQVCQARMLVKKNINNMTSYTSFIWTKPGALAGITLRRLKPWCQFLNHACVEDTSCSTTASIRNRVFKK
jgi:hypothetical protein